MNKLFIIFLLITAVPAVVFADEDIFEEERIDHYDPGKPKNLSEAIEWINKSTKKIDSSFKDNKMEAIHEQSYHLESAVEYIGDYINNVEDSLDRLDESVQIIHFASEKREVETVKKTLSDLKYNAEKLVGSINDK